MKLYTKQNEQHKCNKYKHTDAQKLIEKYNSQNQLNKNETNRSVYIVIINHVHICFDN